MSITYTKQIVSIGCYTQINGESDVVFRINWMMNGSEDIFNNSLNCVTDILYNAGEPFTPYKELTEEQTINWIEQYTLPEQMNSYKQQIEDNIKLQKQIQYPTLPWLPNLSA